MNKLVLVALLGLSLMGCGGGGGSSSPAPVQAATGVTLDQIAGAWDFVSSGTNIDRAHALICSETDKGTLIVAANGTFTSTVLNHDSCKGDSSNSLTGSFTVDAAGEGTMAVTGGTGFAIHFSKDLNTMILADTTDRDSYLAGTAIKR